MASGLGYRLGWDQERHRGGAQKGSPWAGQGSLTHFRLRAADCARGPHPAPAPGLYSRWGMNGLYTDIFCAVKFTCNSNSSTTRACHGNTVLCDHTTGPGCRTQPRTADLPAADGGLGGSAFGGCRLCAAEQGRHTAPLECRKGTEVRVKTGILVAAELLH